MSALRAASTYAHSVRYVTRLSVKAFKMMVNGELDELPEQAFYMRGGIDEVIEAAERMKAGV